MAQIPILIKSINVDKLDFSNIKYMKELITVCLNFIENAYHYINELLAENQKLRDENNRLKGEQGKPDIKPSVNKEKENDENINKDKTVGKKTKRDKDSEIIDEPSPKIGEKPKKKWTKTSKKDKVHIDRIETIDIDKDTLPDDAEFKGYVEVIKQEIEIKTKNVLFKAAKYYSPSENKTYTAEIPPEFQGTEFGPELKALIHYLYFDCRVTENKIHDFLIDNGILISEGTISNILTKEFADVLTKEKEDIFETGLHSDTYNQTDDTGFRYNGDNCYTTIVCNDFYTAYFINERKNQETVKKILHNADINAAEFEILICDDAPQFHNITNIRGLCWVHEARHYKKDLRPIIDTNIELLKTKYGEIWDFYRSLLDYKENPTEEMKEELSSRFDEIFSETTGYENLDKRLKLTLDKKEFLLAVLDNPEIPLHNNLSESGIRPWVVKVKISGGTRSPEGSKAWENNMTILETCKKLGVKYFEYLKDIFSKKMKLPRLADLIKEKSINNSS